MNKKGQALVEFIIIVPIFVILMLAAFDYVQIYKVKMDLESKIEEVILNENTLDNKYFLNKREENGKLVYHLSLEVDLFSPLMHAVLDSPYTVFVERVVNE